MKSTKGERRKMEVKRSSGEDEDEDVGKLLIIEARWKGGSRLPVRDVPSARGEAFGRTDNLGSVMLM